MPEATCKYCGQEIALVEGKWRDGFDRPHVPQSDSALEASHAELLEALKEFAAASALPTQGDYSGFEYPSKTYDPSFGGGECEKHGRYYGSCASCRYDYDGFQHQQNVDARRKRNDALRLADEHARAAIAKAEEVRRG